MERINFVDDKASIGNDVKIGLGTVVEAGAVIGDSVSIGDYCLIRGGVTIGDRTKVMHYVELRAGTSVGANCYVDSRVSTSGDCTIGQGSTLRFGVIIARGCVIGDNCYLAPRVMTNNLDTEQHSIGGAHLGEGCFIGTHAVLQHGITLAPRTKVGAMAFVTKSVDKEGVTLIGVPARPL